MDKDLTINIERTTQGSSIGADDAFDIEVHVSIEGVRKLSRVQFRILKDIIRTEIHDACSNAAESFTENSSTITIKDING